MAVIVSSPAGNTIVIFDPARVLVARGNHQKSVSRSTRLTPVIQSPTFGIAIYVYSTTMVPAYIDLFVLYVRRGCLAVGVVTPARDVVGTVHSTSMIARDVEVDDCAVGGV